MAKAFKKKLVEEVIKEIKDNIEAGDETAIDCMLEGLLDLPGADGYLLDFLPEETAHKIRKNKPRKEG